MIKYDKSGVLGKTLEYHSQEDLLGMIVNLATVADSRMILGADSKSIANQKALEMVSHIITKKFNDNNKKGDNNGQSLNNKTEV